MVLDSLAQSLSFFFWRSASLPSKWGTCTATQRSNMGALAHLFILMTRLFTPRLNRHLAKMPYFARTQRRPLQEHHRECHELVLFECSENSRRSWLFPERFLGHGYFEFQCARETTNFRHWAGRLLLPEGSSLFPPFLSLNFILLGTFHRLSKYPFAKYLFATF